MAWAALSAGVGDLHQSSAVHAGNQHQPTGAAAAQAAATASSLAEAAYSGGWSGVAASDSDQRFVREGQAGEKLIGCVDRFELNAGSASIQACH